MTAIELVLGRLKLEEGERLKAYDDATGKTVVAPVGKLSWGWGFNLEAIGSSGLFAAMATYILTGLDKQLQAYAFYKLDPVRQSVLLDIAYNEGVGGLLHFPHMLAYLKAGDFTSASAECKIADPRVDAQRYAPLRQILLTGVA
jgi:GH24 family phage-related lysozyme (muramidase)